MVGWIRSVWRFFYFAFSTAFGIVGFLWVILWGADKDVAGQRFRRKWLSHVPGRVGLHMEMKGTPYTETCLYVGNHISYIDPIVVLTYVDANVVAKAEIARWPLVGLSAHIVGTIFVKREEKSSREEAARAIREALENGISILVFPEGTTSAGPGTLPFRPRSFDAAYEAGIPVQPVAICYESPEVAYVGDHTFLPHFLSLVTKKEIHGKVVFGPLLYGEDTCNQARDWIEGELMKYVKKPFADELAQKA